MLQVVAMEAYYPLVEFENHKYWYFSCLLEPKHVRTNLFGNRQNIQFKMVLACSILSDSYLTTGTLCSAKNRVSACRNNNVAQKPGKIAQTASARLRVFSTKQLCCRKLRFIHRRAIQIAIYFQFCTVLALFFVGACSSFSRAGIIESPKKIIGWTISGTNCSWWKFFRFHVSPKNVFV